MKKDAIQHLVFSIALFALAGREGSGSNIDAGVTARDEPDFWQGIVISEGLGATIGHLA